MLTRLHAVAGALALMTIITFWLTSAWAELFGTHAQIEGVKQAILFGMLVLVPAMAIAGSSGFRLGRGWKSPLVAKKRKRMAIAGLNGLIVLLPSAFVLAQLAEARNFGPLFFVVQTIEFTIGAVNIGLLSLNMRDGLRLSRRKTDSRMPSDARLA